jgi:hypothetical protein
MKVVHFREAVLRLVQYRGMPDIAAASTELESI